MNKIISSNFSEKIYLVDMYLQILQDEFVTPITRPNTSFGLHPYGFRMLRTSNSTAVLHQMNNIAGDIVEVEEYQQNVPVDAFDKNHQWYAASVDPPLFWKPGSFFHVNGFAPDSCVGCTITQRRIVDELLAQRSSLLFPNPCQSYPWLLGRLLLNDAYVLCSALCAKQLIGFRCTASRKQIRPGMLKNPSPLLGNQIYS